MNKTKNLDVVIGMDVFPVLIITVGMVYVPHIYTGMLLNALDFIPELTEIEGLSDYNSSEGRCDILPVKSIQNFDLCKSNTFSNTTRNSMKNPASVIDLNISELETETVDIYPLSVNFSFERKNTGLTGLKKIITQSQNNLKMEIE